MTLPVVSPRKTFVGTGTRGPFSLQADGTPIRIRNPADLKVWRYSSVLDEVGQLLTLNVDYTVDNADPDAASLLLTTVQLPLASTERLVTERTQDIAAVLDLIAGGDFSAPVLAGAISVLSEQLQELRRDSDRSVRVSWRHTGKAAIPVPPASGRKFLTAEADGTITQTDAPLLQAVEAGYLVAVDNEVEHDGATPTIVLDGVGASEPAHLSITYDGQGPLKYSLYYVAYDADLGRSTVTLTVIPPKGTKVRLEPRVFPGKDGAPGQPANMDGYTTAGDESDGDEWEWFRTITGLNRRQKGNKRRFKSLGGFIKTIEDWLSRIYPGSKVTRTSAAGGFQAALTARAAGGTIIVDTDETITSGVSATVTGDLTLEWVRGHRTTFNIPNNTDDCITIANPSYSYIRFRNPDIDFGFTGRDGFVFDRGHIQWFNINLQRAWRDLWVCDMDDTWDWFENFNISGGVIAQIGRHVIHVIIDTLSGVPFHNENNWDVEIRGIGMRHAGTENGGHGCNVVRITGVNSATPTKIAAWRFRGSNWDCIQAMSYDVANSKYFGQSGYVAGSSIGDMVEAIALNGSQFDVGDFDFRGCGGLESTSGEVLSKFVIRLITDGSPGAAITRGGHQLGFTFYGWAYRFTDDIMNLDSVGGRHGSEGRYLEKILTKPNGIYAKGDENGWATGFRDIGRGFKKIVTMVSSTVVTVDIPVGTNGTYNDQSPIIVYAGHQPYWNGVGVAARWEVWVASTDKVNVRLFDELDTGAANAFDPSAVTWSRPSNGVVRMSITCGASVGAGGRNSTCWVAAARPEGIYNRFEKTTEAL